MSRQLARGVGVIEAGGDGAIGHGGRGAVGVRIEHVDAVSHRARGECGHPTELTAAEHTDSSARLDHARSRRTCLVRLARHSRSR